MLLTIEETCSIVGTESKIVGDTEVIGIPAATKSLY